MKGKLITGIVELSPHQTSFSKDTKYSQEEPTLWSYVDITNAKHASHQPAKVRYTQKLPCIFYAFIFNSSVYETT
jgi:hypothetical protein